MILVTGATGLLGSRLLFDLISKGFQVRALRRPDSSLATFDYYISNKSSLLEKIEWVDGDLLDLYSLKSALLGVKQVFHCGGMVSFNPKDFDVLTRVNINGTANIVNLSLDAGIEKFCHVSSVAALGRTGIVNQINEDAVWKSSKNNSAYAVSKYAAEREVWRGIAEGLNAVIVNPGIIIGPGNWKRDSSVLFSKIKSGLSFYSSGVTGFVDVKDVSEIMIQLMASQIKSERFILVGENLPFRNVMDQIAQYLNVKKPNIHAGSFLSGLAWRIETIKSFIFNSPPVITKETARSASLVNYYSNKKIIDTIGYSFHSIEEAIQDGVVAFEKQKM